MIEITTPPGRIVWGHPLKSKGKTNKETRQPVIGPDGQQRQVWSFGVAFDKASFQQAIWPAMAQEAATVYPSGVPNKFSWKYQDGDGIDGEGKPYNQREGYAGCFVLAISSELMAPPLYKLENGAYRQLPPEAIKCGDYVVCGLQIKVNVPQDKSHTPGLYINPTVVELIGYGTEIQSIGAPDPMAVLGGRTYQLPPGASATPIATPGGGAPGMPGMPQQAPQPGYPPQPAGQPYPAPAMAPQPGYPPQPAPQPYPTPQPGTMPPPAPDFVHNAGQPQQPPAMAPQPGYPPQPQPMAPPAAPQPYPAPQPGYGAPQAGQPMPGMLPGR